MGDSERMPRRVLLGRVGSLVLVALIVTLAVIQVRGWDGTVNADGVSYLDLARQYASGDVSAVANGYWSPLYPLLLGVVQAVAQILGGAPEMTLVLATNIVIFAVAALALARLARSLATPAEVDASVAIRVARGLAAAALCVWALLRMITATTVTPDALLAVWLFVATSEIAAAAIDEPSLRRHLRFGAALALGYWTKAVFLPVAFVALVAYVLATPRDARRRATTRALLPLLVIALPLVLVQSWTQGRPSFGETGRLNYRWYVAQLPHATPVREPVVATRARVRRGEAVVVALDGPPGGALFTGATTGSYPYWYDPARYEPRGGAPFSLDAQLAMLSFNAHWFRVTMGAFSLFVIVGVVAAAMRDAVRPRRLLAALPAAAMLGLYALTHPEGRLGAAAIVCVLLVVVNLADVGARGRRRPLLAIECVALLLLSVVAVGRTAKRIPTGPPQPRAVVPTAASLRAAGVPAGGAIALAGTAFGQFWTHEAEVRIVAVLPKADSLGGASERAMRAVMTEAAARGVPLDAVVWSGDAVHVTDAVPLVPGWWALSGPRSHTAIGARGKESGRHR